MKFTFDNEMTLTVREEKSHCDLYVNGDYCTELPEFVFDEAYSMAEDMTKYIKDNPETETEVQITTFSDMMDVIAICVTIREETKKFYFEDYI